MVYRHSLYVQYSSVSTGDEDEDFSGMNNSGNRFYNVIDDQEYHIHNRGRFGKIFHAVDVRTIRNMEGTVPNCYRNSLYKPTMYSH